MSEPERKPIKVRFLENYPISQKSQTILSKNTIRQLCPKNPALLRTGGVFACVLHAIVPPSATPPCFESAILSNQFISLNANDIIIFPLHEKDGSEVQCIEESQKYYITILRDKE